MYDVYKRGRFPQTRDLWSMSASMGELVGRVSPCTPSRGGRGRRAAVDFFRGVFWVRRDFFVFFSRFLFFERTRPIAGTRPSCLMYLSTSTGVRTGCHYLMGLSVRLCMCNIRRFY